MVFLSVCLRTVVREYSAHRMRGASELKAEQMVQSYSTAQRGS